MMKLIEFIKRYFNKFTVIFRETSYILIALFLLQLLLYVRLLPRVSRDLWVTITQYDLLYLLIRILFVVIEIYFLVNLLHKVETNNTFLLGKKIRSITIAFFSFFKTIFITFIGFFKAILINFYQFITYLINVLGTSIFYKEHLSYNIIRILAKTLLFSNKSTIYGFLLMLLLIPKIIFVIAFSYDVFVTQHLHYSFKCIPYLLIPLIESFIVFVFTNFYKQHWKSINGFMEKNVYTINNEYITEYQFIKPYRNKKPEWFLSFPDYFSNHYLILQNIDIFFDEYTNWKQKNKWFLGILLLISILRLFALLYLLFYGII